MLQQRHVVFISRQRVVGKTNGSSAYLLDLAAAARRAAMIPILVQPSPSLFGRVPVLRMRSEMDVFAQHRVRGALRIGRYLIAVSPAIWIAAVKGVAAKLARRAGLRFAWLQDRKAPYSISVPWIPADMSYTDRHTPDGSIVVADYIFQTKAFEVVREKACATATIMHDLFHRRAETVAATGVVDSVTTVNKIDEIRMLGLADLVIAIQQAEADFILQNLPDQSVLTVPMSFPIADEPQPGHDTKILFVGSNTEPNVAGLKWFFENCWPKILDAVPNATLTVAGSVSSGMAGFPHPRSVEYLGIVDDLAPLYARAGVVISPLTFGSGLKVKLIEALALGKAMVATSVTLQGVETIAERAVFKTDHADEFANAIVSLTSNKNLRFELGASALAVAKEHFSAAVAHGSFAAWLFSKATPISPPYIVKGVTSGKTKFSHQELGS